MIIPEVKNSVTMSGQLETVNFDIKTNDGKMFHILSNLYSNPLGAVVREISTNCMDGHKIAGTPELPFDIILPGKLDNSNFITFRDYGPGMPEDVVMSIFTTFGQSTKTNSNEETGCLGLGSKSPLAITDSFTVTSVNDGIKTTYSVSKDDQRKPVLAKFGSTSTEEGNGLIVTVPLSKIHFENILMEIENQLKYFDVKPNVYKNNVLLKIDWEGDFNYTKAHQWLMGDRSNSDSHTIVQGGIGYHLNVNLLLNSFNVTENSLGFLEQHNMTISAETKQVISKLFYHYSMICKMDMGTVSFAPSREELIYDNNTCQHIMTSILKELVLIQETYSKLFSYFPTHYDYKQAGYYWGDSHLKNVIFKDDIEMYNKMFLYKNKLLPYFMEKDESYSKNLNEIQNYSFFKEFLDIRLFKSSFNKIKISQMKKKIKDYNNVSDKYESQKISDYLTTVLSSNVKIVLVDGSDKYFKKHISNYVLNNDDLQIIVVKVFDRSNTNVNIKDFAQYVGLAKTNVLEFNTILNSSLQYIKDGKVTTTKSVAYQPRTLKFNFIGASLQNIDSWSSFQTNSKEVSELVGLYIPTFRNNPVLNHNLEKYNHTIGTKLINQKSYFSKIFDFLMSAGLEKIQGYSRVSKIKVYAGNEKNFKKTKLIHIEDFLVQCMKDMYDHHAYYALFYDIKKYTTSVCISSKMEIMVKNLEFFRGNYDGILSSEYIQLLKYILKEMKPFDEWFWKSDQKFYELERKICFYKLRDFEKYESNDQKINSLNLDNSEEFEFLQSLNIKREHIDLRTDYFDLPEQIRDLFCYENFKHTWFSSDELIIMLIEKIVNVNKNDFIIQKFKDIKLFPKKEFQKETKKVLAKVHDKNVDEDKLLVAE